MEQALQPKHKCNQDKGFGCSLKRKCCRTQQVAALRWQLMELEFQHCLESAPRPCRKPCCRLCQGNNRNPLECKAVHTRFPPVQPVVERIRTKQVRMQASLKTTTTLTCSPFEVSHKINLPLTNKSKKSVLKKTVVNS